MNISVTIDQASLDSFVRSTEQRLGQAKADMEQRMAMEFYQVVMDNFGEIGRDRPFEWADLRPSYAAKVGRSYATLKVTGALQESIELGGNFVRMSDDNVPYALAHHYGRPDQNLAARRVFPIKEDGEITDYTTNVVLNAAREEFSKAFA